MKEVSQVKSNITMTKVRFLFSCKCCIKPASYDCSVDYLYQVKARLVYGFSLFTFKLNIFFKKSQTSYADFSLLSYIRFFPAEVF